MSLYNKKSALDVGLFVNFLIILVVALNAYSIAQYEHGEILNINSYQFAQHFLVLILLVTVFWKIIKYPDNAIDTLFYLTVLTGGMYLYRFAIFDELITTAALAGIMVAKKQRENKNYGGLYNFLLFYIFAMSIVGLLVYIEIRAIRYIYIAGILITLLYFMQRYKLQIGNEQDFHRGMLKATLVYELAYLINALIILYYRPLETIIGIGEAGAGYQGVIFLFTIPSCFKILGLKDSIKLRILAFIAILVAAIIAVVADSRYVMLTLAISFLFSVRNLDWKTLIVTIFTLIVITSIFGYLFSGNHLIIFTLLGDTFAQDIGMSRNINYYGKVIETASGDQGRALLVLNGFYYFLDGKITILTGIGTYGYVHEAYKTYELLLKNLGIIDNIVNYTSFGTPPRPPSLATYVVDYGLFFLGMIILLWLSLIKKAFILFKKRPEVMSYPINLLLFMTVGEQLDTISTYFLLFPVFSWYIRRKSVDSLM
jgi:hypothetical protein